MPSSPQAELVANGTLYRYYDLSEISNVLLTTGIAYEHRTSISV